MTPRALYHHRTQATDAQGIHINEMVKAFRRKGIDIHMVALVKDEALGQASRPGILGKISDRIPSLVYELMEIGFNIPGIVRLYRAVGREHPAFIYERYSIYNMAGLVVSRLTRVPLIEEVNAPLALEKKSYGRIHFPALAQRLETLIINHAFKTIAVTTALKKILVRNGALENKIVVMPNGVDMSAFPSPPADRTGGQKVTLGFIGWFKPWHGLEPLIEIFAARKWHKKGVHLLLVGEGPLRPRLEQMIARLQLDDHISITGAVPRDRLTGWLQRMDIALQPAATAYACPMKIIEYMAAGKAIVAPDQPNIRELLVHEKNGLLFEPGNLQDLTRHIEQLVEKRSWISALGRAARATVVQTPLTWDHNAAQVLALMPPSQGATNRPPMEKKK